MKGYWILNGTDLNHWINHTICDQATAWPKVVSIHMVSPGTLHISTISCTKEISCHGQHEVCHLESQWNEVCSTAAIARRVEKLASPPGIKQWQWWREAMVELESSIETAHFFAGAYTEHFSMSSPGHKIFWTSLNWWCPSPPSIRSIKAAAQTQCRIRITVGYKFHVSHLMVKSTDCLPSWKKPCQGWKGQPCRCHSWRSPSCEKPQKLWRQTVSCQIWSARGACTCRPWPANIHLHLTNKLHPCRESWYFDHQWLVVLCLQKRCSGGKGLVNELIRCDPLQIVQSYQSLLIFKRVESVTHSTKINIQQVLDFVPDDFLPPIVL